MHDKMNAAAPGVEEVANAAAQADQAGKFTELDKALKAEGVTMKASAWFILAQKDPRTKGKTPEEVVALLEQDPSIAQDVADYVNEPEAKAAPAEEEPSEEESTATKDYLASSASMKDRDPKEAMMRLKKMGKKPADLEKDFDAKARFMSMDD